jgi:methionyl-tRNA formyltransferase
LRVTFLCNRDIHANVALNLLMPVLQEHEVTIFLSDGPSRSAVLPSGFAALTAAERVVPNTVLWPLADAAEDLGARYASFDRCAKRLHGTCASLNEPNSADGIRTLRGTRPDLIVSIRYTRILREEAIALPRLGVINLHSGPLPDFRGVLATFRGFLNGASHIGCTLHRIVDPGIDTGPIIRVATIPTPSNTCLFDAIQSVYAPGAEMIADAIHTLARGDDLRVTPPASSGTYYTWPSEADLTNFLRRGFRLVDLDAYAKLLSYYVPNAV